MLILLPPSETKRHGGARTFEPASLSAHAALGETRARVRAALEAVSADEAAATKALKLGVKNRSEREHNLQLRDSGVLPAIERYTGVLYDALDAPALDPGARKWLDAHVAVQSALFGLVGAGEPIPAYRLSAGSSLPGLAGPLKRHWVAAHEHFAWPETGLILDLRSKDYAALAPLPADRGWFVNVVQRGTDGTVRALNHFNKAAKGDLVRRLATTLAGSETGAGAPATPAELLMWAEEHGVELRLDDARRELVLVTELGAPRRD